MNRTLITSLVALVLASTSAFGSQIFICQSCTNPAGGDPNFITNPGSFAVGEAGNGNDTGNGILVIVGVYNGNSTSTAPTLTFSSMTFSPAGVGDWGETTDMTGLGPGQDAYLQIGLHDINGGHSETFTNWNLGEVKDGLAPATSFELFAYDIPTAIAGGTTISIGVSGAPVGSVVVAFSCKAGGPTAESGMVCPDGQVESTPFTNAGLIARQVSTIPEPGTLALVGTALLGVGFARRKWS